MIAAVKIVKTPAGEAPLWVRESWVGCFFPVEISAPNNAVGVLTYMIVSQGPRDYYWVSWEKAIENA